MSKQSVLKVIGMATDEFNKVHLEAAQVLALIAIASALTAALPDEVKDDKPNAPALKCPTCGREPGIVDYNEGFVVRCPSAECPDYTKIWAKDVDTALYGWNAAIMAMTKAAK